jgi:hypothetical protein
MNWLLPQPTHTQKQIPAEDQARRDALPQFADRYRGVALGVECAWPLFAEQGAARPAP